MVIMDNTMGTRCVNMPLGCCRSANFLYIRIYKNNISLSCSLPSFSPPSTRLLLTAVKNDSRGEGHVNL